MKKALFFLFLISFVISLSAEQMLHKTLPNGLEVVVKENFSNNSVAVYCYLRTGSVHEEEYIGMGLSHVLEHVVSGGSTEFHTEKEYEEMGRRMGSIVNASTWKDWVNYYIQVDKQYANDAVKELVEHVGYAALNESEMERELKVIEKEIVMRSTPPTMKVYQRMNEIFYPDSPYRYPVIGYTDKLRNITHDILVEYYKRRHSPENMIVIVCGNFKAEDMMAVVEKEWGGLKQRGRIPLVLNQQRLLEGENTIVEEFEIKQPTMMINYQLPEAAALDETAIETALNCLMQQRNSPITYRLVEKEKLCTQFYGYYAKENDQISPSIQIWCETDSTKNLPRIIAILDEEIAKAGSKGIDEKQLKRVVSTEKARQMLDTPDAATEAEEIGETLLSGSRQPDNSAVIIEKYEKLTVNDVNEAIKKYLLPGNRIVFIGVPTGEAKILEKKETGKQLASDITKITINPALTLLYRKNNRKPLVHGVLWFPMSSEIQRPETVGSIEYMVGLITSGPEGQDPLDISQWEEDRSIGLDVSTRRDGTVISFRCLKEDYPKLKTLLKDSFAKPAFAESEIERNRQYLETRLKYQLTSDDANHNEFINQYLFPSRRESITLEARTRHLLTLTTDSLKVLYHKYFKADKALVTLFGDIEKDEATAMAKELYSYLPKGIPDGSRLNKNPIFDGQTHLNQYDFEPVNITIEYTAPTKDSTDFAAFTVAAILLTSSRGRLHEATRGENNNLAYYAYATHDWNANWGVMDVISQTSMDKKDTLVAALAREVQKLSGNDVTVEEIALAVQEQKKIMESYMGDNDLPEWLTYYEVNGLGWEYVFNGYEDLEKVTPEQIKAVALKYLKTPTIFISEPSGNVKKMVD